MTTTETPPGRYRIAEIARRSGFTPSALRYYETAGVLAAPARTPAGYRLYSDRDLERLRLIARAKDLGCTLDEIAELVRAWEGDECGPVKHRLRALVHDKVAATEAHLVEQEAFARQLRATAAALAGRPLDGPCDDSCGCTATTDAEGAGCGAGCGCGPGAEAVVPPGRRGGGDDAVPVACSLSGTEVDARVGEWQHVLAGATGRLPLPDGARLELPDGACLAELVALVEAERRCCPSLAFAITVDHRGVGLEVTAPPAGQHLLATVLGERA